VCMCCRLEEHVEWTGPEILRKFDKRMAAATDGLKEGLNWGEIVNSGGSPAPLLAIHTSHPTEQVSPPDSQGSQTVMLTRWL